MQMQRTRIKKDLTVASEFYRRALESALNKK